MSNDNFRSGYAAFIGRPNAGKSTLLNRLVGERIAAVSNKPQTTRHRIQGIVTAPEGQIVFVDTPGVHKPGFLLNRRMMTAVHDAISVGRPAGPYARRKRFDRQRRQVRARTCKAIRKACDPCPE